VLGSVRLGPVDDGPDLGWWFGGRLVVDAGCPVRGVGAALDRAACAQAESAGVLRFETTVQARNEVLFVGLAGTRCGQ
jgi:predicted N-acetyltransferase YhbS